MWLLCDDEFHSRGVVLHAAAPPAQLRLARLARPHRGREELAVQQVRQGSSRRDVNVHQAAATSMQSALVLLVLRACATPSGSNAARGTTTIARHAAEVTV